MAGWVASQSAQMATKRSLGPPADRLTLSVPAIDSQDCLSTVLSTLDGTHWMLESSILDKVLFQSLGLVLGCLACRQTVNDAGNFLGNVVHGF